MMDQILWPCRIAGWKKAEALEEIKRLCPPQVPMHRLHDRPGRSDARVRGWAMILRALIRRPEIVAVNGFFEAQEPLLWELFLEALPEETSVICFGTALAVLTALSFSVCVRAEESLPPETTLPVETTLPPETTLPVEMEPVFLPTELTIETKHTYDGMKQAYSDGYIPTCRNGSVRIVLPLCCSGMLYGDQLTASLILDSGAFVAANYEKTFQLQ